MSQINSTRSGCKDVFRAFLVKNATYSGEQEIPCLKKRNYYSEESDIVLESYFVKCI